MVQPPVATAVVPTCSPRPPLAWRLGAGTGIVAMAVLSTSEQAAARVEQATGGRLTQRSTRALLGATVAVHVAESVVAARKAGAAGLDARPWVVGTLMWGFPVLMQLRSCTRSTGSAAARTD